MDCGYGSRLQISNHNISRNNHARDAGFNAALLRLEFEAPPASFLAISVDALTLL